MKNLFKILFLSFIFLVNNAFAALELELTQGVDNAIPIAVSPFSGPSITDSEGDNITDTVGNDLKNSGRFRLAFADEFSFDSPEFEAWRAKKIEAVVTGQVKSIDGGKFSVTFKLFDVYNKKKLFEKEFKIKKEQARKLAHHISDIVYQQITGDRGVFSTKIAYVLVERKGYKAKRKTKYKLQIADSDGHNAHALLTSSFPLMSPSWSPDGKKLSYVSFEGHRAAIYIQDIATGKRKVLSKLPGINGAPA